jgi:hypothetical protein
MINLRCESDHTVTLTILKAFQGNLKRRSSEDIDNLIISLKEEGLLMPLAVWENDNRFNILDGHARFEALMRMAFEDASILEQEIPIIRVFAETEEDAKKALLQITSSYGKVTKKGITSFVASIPNYVLPAPVVVKAFAPVAQRKAEVDTTSVILKLRVPKEMVKRLTEVLKGVEGVTIL